MSCGPRPGSRAPYGYGTTSAREGAVFVVFHALILPFDVADAVLDQPPISEGKARTLPLIRERIRTRKPAAYVLGESWFAGLELYVDERVLVPRSPIAELIESRFSP